LRGIVKRSGRLVVGLSGGADSVVLLDCLQRVARERRLRLSALHVNHQLSPNAARWSAFCRRLCRARGIPFDSVKVDVPRGASVEAAARGARHAVFASQRCDYVVLAHHRDDQVETLLLQLLRGAGVKGLAGMPLLREVQGTRHRAQGTSSRSGSSSLIPHPSSLKILRPLLDVTRQEILEYAKQRRLKWIEDESNLDTRFRRNFLRHEILPAIALRFPSYGVTIARSASHLAEASRLLDEVAVNDGAAQFEDGTLGVEALRRLPPARARNLLRFFLADRGIDPPGTARLEEALRQALAAKQDARVAVDVGRACLMRYAGRLHVVPAAGLAQRFSRRWRGEARLALPEAGGVLILERAKGRGISAARLRGGAVTIRPRTGGERFQPDCLRPRRSLKNLLQEARVAPWLRERLPLIFHDEMLVWVPGIGVDCAFQAGKGEPALLPRWSPAPLSF
jgi:tRNA(Ile)-lysidine synthase